MIVFLYGASMIGATLWIVHKWAGFLDAHTILPPRRRRYQMDDAQLINFLSLDNSCEEASDISDESNSVEMFQYDQTDDSLLQSGGMGFDGKLGTDSDDSRVW